MSRARIIPTGVVAAVLEITDLQRGSAIAAWDVDFLCIFALVAAIYCLLHNVRFDFE